MMRMEKETIIRFDEEGLTAKIYTSSQRVASKLLKQGIVPKEIYQNKKEITGWLFEVNSHSIILKPSRFSIRMGIKRKKVI